MKNLFNLCLLLVFIFTSFSCSKDKGDVDLIVGKWDPVKYEYIEFEDGVEVDSEIITDPELFDFYFELTSDYKFFVYNSDGMGGWDLVETLNYEKNGTILTLTDNGDSFDANIITLTNSQFIFSLDFTEEDEGIVYRYMETYTLERRN